MANKVVIWIGICHLILLDELNMKRMSAKLVLKFLTEEQMEHCIEVCLGLKNQVSNDPNFIKSVITGEKSWVSDMVPKRKFNYHNGRP